MEENISRERAVSEVRGMAELDEKLNALLSDPNSMAQIMRLAQSLSGDSQDSGQEPPPQSPPQQRQVRSLDRPAITSFLQLRQLPSGR